MKARWFRGAALLLALALSACVRSDLRPDYVREASTSIPVQSDALLAGYAARMTAGHGTDSGFLLLADSVDALLARIVLADRAKVSIDVQYYLFHNDATGRLVAAHLLAAADRGVRVRVLLDDLHKLGQDDVLRALDGHPHIEIRLFNPFHDRRSSMWSMGKQFIGDFSRLNRRMHNKSYIVDGSFAIVGGRNIGDEYFDASDVSNFRDLDVLGVGPFVGEVIQMFDTFWNSEPSVPIGAFESDGKNAQDLAGVRKQLDDSARKIRDTEYATNVFSRIGDLKLEKPSNQWAWGPAEFISDDPGKVDPTLDDKELHLVPRIREWLESAQQRILLVSPYFVPGDKGVAFLAERRAHGVEVEVLTNSLASTDAGNVYAAYASYRPKLLADGVQLYELKPDAAYQENQRHTIGSSSSSLHAKAMVVDSDHAFVGSMNLDPRSGNLNTEDGVLVNSPALAKAIADLFEDATDPSVTYRVRLREGTGAIYWETIENGETVLYDKAPRTSAWRRAKASMTRALPIEGLL